MEILRSSRKVSSREQTVCGMISYRMRNKYAFIIFTLLLLYCSSGFAKSAIKIEITGVSEEVKKNIESSLDIDSLSTNSPEQIHQFFLSSPDTVKKALEPFGYFKAKVYPSLSHRQNIWFFRFQINPGAPVRITQFHLNISGKGAHDPIFQQLLPDFPLAKGQIFSVPNYNKAKRLLSNTALSHGYFDASFEEKQILIDLRKNTAAIILDFNTGSRSHFGDIIFNKNPYDINFLKRYASFSPGEYYAADKVEKFQEGLDGSGYFSKVIINPKIEQRKNNEVPIKVFVKSLPARQYNLGLGYGTDTGARGSIGFEWRRVTTDGQRLKADLQASQIGGHLQVNYIIPGRKPATDQYILSVAAEKEDQKLGQSDLQKIIASYVTTVWAWQQTVALTLQRERFTLEAQPTQTQFLLFPSISWMKLSQDDPLRPSRGHRISLTLLGAPKLFGNTPFLQEKFDIKAIYPILTQDRIIAQGSLNYTQTPDLNSLPLSFQFFAGGSQSIRGYSYNSIGPGSTSWTASLEYRRHIKGNWYAAAFYDAGSVTQSITQNLKRGIGLGAVWQSPVGTLELTVAQAQDLPGKPIAIQFSMGPDL